ncbi:reverse transcriptase [Moniliophthora roreri MCA 2997]|uniref:Reverse transcriptase n=1 Tax=Moniliophthora roreri (strain MCA 2997) TaxID=1381753 RepID=V2XN94_MONRO|nr:reverse transcriptase [Moniliophthora roreri MCA 2997]
MGMIHARREKVYHCADQKVPTGRLPPPKLVKSYRSSITQARELLEKIIAHSLTFRAGQLGLVLDTQFGGQAHSSAEDAVLTFVNDIYAAWNHGKVVSALTFDIKRYFDFVNHDRLLAKLQEHGILLEEVKWVASFLSDREAAVCLDGMQGSMKPVKNGIP